jgi:hypothetical protein
LQRSPFTYGAEAPVIELHELEGHRIRATVGAETRELGPGDAVLYGTRVPHLIEALVDTRWIEIKAPPSATWPTAGPAG